MGQAYNLSILNPDLEVARLARQAHSSFSHELPVLAAAGLRSGMSVVDIGSGSGHFTAQLATLAYPAKVVGIEKEDAMVRVARSLPHLGNLDFVLADALSAQPRPEFDFVFCRLVVNNTPEPKTLIAKMVGYARPGGLICVSDIDDGTVVMHPSPPTVEHVNTLFLDFFRRQGGDRHVGRRLREMLTHAGALDVKTHVVAVDTQTWGRDVFLGRISTRTRRLVKAGMISEGDAALAEAEAARWIEDDSSYGCLTKFVVVGRSPH